MLDVATPELPGSPFDRLLAPVRIAPGDAAISPLFEPLFEELASQARDLLVTTSLPVKQVALRCAYRSRSQFSAAFKSRFGLDPGHYRRQQFGDTR